VTSTCNFSSCVNINLLVIHKHFFYILQSVVVFPSRAATIENLLRVFSPRLALVDAGLTRYLPKKWLTALPAVVKLLCFLCNILVIVLL